MHYKLRKLREDKRVSQEEMGNLLSISQPQYQRKETGFAPFTDEECTALAEYFNVPVEEIMEVTGFAQHNHKQQGGVATIYYIADRLIDEVKEMNSYLKEELLWQKEENHKLKMQVEELQRKK